jgi:hypothetical protein
MMKATLPKCEVQEGGGAWVVARQGTAVTLVRNERFLSPAGKKKTYANHSIYNQIVQQDPAARSVRRPVTTGSFKRSGSAEQSGERSTSHLDVSRHSRGHTIDGDGRPSTAWPKGKRATAVLGGAKAGGPGQRSPLAKRPGSSASVRPGGGETKPRPKSSTGYSSLALEREDKSPRRPQTSTGTRSLGPGDSRRMLDALPARTPLRPVSAVGWQEQRRAEQSFLNFVSAGDSPRQETGPDDRPKGTDSKETETVDGQNGEKYCTPTKVSAGESGPTRRPRWQEIIHLRKNSRLRSMGMSIETTSPTRAEKMYTRAPFEYNAPPVQHTEAAQRLKHIKGQPAAHRFWVEKRDRTAFSGKTTFEMASRIKQKKALASDKVVQEHEFINALLHEQGRTEPLNRNAEEWISGYSSLMDKRQKLRHLEGILAQAQADYKGALGAVTATQHRLKNGSISGQERAELTTQLQEEVRRADDLEACVAETRARCDVFTISIKEYQSLQPGLGNHVGDVEEWLHWKQELQERVFKSEEAEQGYLRRAQTFLDNHRTGWWQEHGCPSPQQPYLLQGELSHFTGSEQVSRGNRCRARQSGARVLTLHILGRMMMIIINVTRPS